ncbi:DUF3300 domain-containing protein [Serratia quinivorans]|uniref:DUF3300 domain-containing protein n=1 Tax=Serratia quinivorans TaxID=137545 RepID=UPI003F9BEDC9
MFNMKKLPWVLMALLALSGCDRAQDRPAAASSAAAPAPQVPGSSVRQSAPNAEQLYSLLGPVALFPDNLLAQVLAASTTPEQVNAANTWLLQNKNLTGTALTKAVNAQPWAPAVKAMVTFPDVLQQMAQNPGWTQALGTAYTQAPSDVMNAVQQLRQRASNSGALKSNAQQQVVVTANNSANAPAVAAGKTVAAPTQTIVIKSAQPGVVYVPSYGTAVYGNPPVAYYPGYAPPPAYSSGDMVATGLISFTAGVMVGSMFDNNWGVHWGGSPVVVYNNHTFVNNNRINRNDWHHDGYGPRASFSEPHFSPARSNFTPMHTAPLAHRAMTSPNFEPRRNAERYTGPTRTAAHQPQRRVEHALPQRDNRLQPERHFAPGPVRLSQEHQPQFQRERDTRPFADGASHQAFSTALNHSWGDGHLFGGNHRRRL